MKLTAILLFTACLQVCAKGYSQITLSEKNAPLEKVFTEISRQSGFEFLYTTQMLESAKKVSIQVANAALAEVLAICFKGQPFSYTIIEKTIIVKPKKETPNEDAIVSPPLDVKGRVTNENGEPVEGVTVMVKGTQNGTTTNANGEFTLINVDASAMLILSAINIEGTEIKVNGKTELNWVAKTKISKLDEIQIIAYGQTSKRLQTGNVSTIKAEDIAKQPVNNPLLALQGRVPGLFIEQATGLPGTGVSVRIQGKNSIQSGNDPLYVIDGIPYSSQLLPSIGDILGRSGSSFGNGSPATGNPLSFINPADIESIDVLKDAAATAIYGSRAANGAILITTKKGKAGQTRLNVTMQSGWGQLTRKLDLLNTEQYLEMRREAKKNDNANIEPTDYDINGTWDQQRYTDWQKELLGGTSQYNDIQASISGGSENTQFLVGGSFHRETTVFPGDFSDRKGSTHFSLNNSSVNKKMKLQVSGKYLADNNQLTDRDLTNTAMVMPPNAPALYNTDGSLNWEPLPNGSSTWFNPMAYLYNTTRILTKNLIGNALISYQLLPGLEIKTNLGYNNLQTKQTLLNPALGQSPESRPSYPRYSMFVNSEVNSWIIEPQVNYKKNWGRSKFEVLIGTSLQETKNELTSIYAAGFNSDLDMENMAAAATITPYMAPLNSVYKYNAVFTRLNYNWKEKYLGEISARRDGSSRFGTQNQFHNFGSVAFGWIFSNEEFIKKKLPFLSFGKLRGSYGTTGNDQIGEYQFLNLYNAYFADAPYQGATGLLPAGLPNPYLEWEETTKLQFGLDAGFFNDRFLFAMNYYRNRSSNQLLPYDLPITAGHDITQNFPATVQNSGWEFSLSTVNYKTKNFNWSSNINFTIPKNKLVAFPGLATSIYAQTFIIGQPITTFSFGKYFSFGGVDPATGLFQFTDSKGNITSDPTDEDRTILTNVAPEFYGGFGNTFSYKGIQLDILFQFVKQKGPNILSGSGVAGTFFTGPYGSLGNQPSLVLNRWQKPGDITSVQRYSADFNMFQSIFNLNSSDAAFSDASYIRLKNLSLSWQLPATWSARAKVQNARLFILGQNLLTITHYKGLDPETKSSSSLPPLRVTTIGLQVTL